MLRLRRRGQRHFLPDAAPASELPGGGPGVGPALRHPVAPQGTGAGGLPTGRQAHPGLRDQPGGGQFYEATLKSAAGKPGRDYLDKRGLTPEVIKAFHLGYAPDEWDSLRRHLQIPRPLPGGGPGGGPAGAPERGGFYDRFRHRIIFPIFDRQSRVIAFGGRIIGAGEPKYLNSPESQLYHKGRSLYGLPQAADALRLTKVALVVEGYLDLISLQNHGIANVLATLGTALTREQVRLLKGLADKVVLVYDGDAAGIKAMQRAFPLFAQEGLPVRALALPAGQDPDDYARSQGVEIFKTAWESAQPWFTFLLEGLIQTHGLEVEGRVRILEELRPYFQAIADPVEQDLWLKTAAQRLGVDEGVLRQSLASFAPISATRIRPATGVTVSLEKALLRWVLGHPETIVWRNWSNGPRSSKAGICKNSWSSLSRITGNTANWTTVCWCSRWRGRRCASKSVS